MKPGKKIIYWDSCVWLAWLQSEKLDAGVMEGMEKTAQQTQGDQVTLVTSVITRIEILECKMSREAADSFKALFHRPNIVMVTLDGKLSDLAHEIRDFHQKINCKLSTPDCIHLATAIAYKVDEFHTLDGGGKRKRFNDLLPLDGNVAGHKLRICLPHTLQPNFLTNLPSSTPNHP